MWPGRAGAPPRRGGSGDGGGDGDEDAPPPAGAGTLAAPPGQTPCRACTSAALPAVTWPRGCAAGRAQTWVAVAMDTCTNVGQYQNCRCEQSATRVMGVLHNKEPASLYHKGFFSTKVNF